MKLVLKVLLGAALLGACFPKTVAVPPTLSPAQTTWAATRWPDATPEGLANGRALYASKCNGCHGYPDLGAVTEAEWPSVAARMGKKASLTPKESDDVLHFVLAARATP